MEARLKDLGCFIQFLYVCESRGELSTVTMRVMFFSAGGTSQEKSGPLHLRSMNVHEKVKIEKIFWTLVNVSISNQSDQL